MIIIETAKMTSKGQVTIPNRVRKMLHLTQGASVAFGLSKEGVMILPCTITAESPHTRQEWEKIHKLTAEKGKVYKTLKGAKKFLENL